MTSQEMVDETEDRPKDRLASPALSYPLDESHWSQNHGPTIFAITAFTLLVGYGVIFFSSASTDDYSKPLVPNNFVPDEDTPPTNESSLTPAEQNGNGSDASEAAIPSGRDQKNATIPQ